MSGNGAKGSAFGYPVSCGCAVRRLKNPVTYVRAFI